jgi:putative phage-type endonuclease
VGPQVRVVTEMDATTDLVMDRTINAHLRRYGEGRTSTPHVMDKIARVASYASAGRVTLQRVWERLLDMRRWRARLEELRVAPQLAQRTPEWYEARHTMVTASDVAQCINRGKFGTQKEFFVKKVAPELAPPFNATLAPLAWGIKYEEVAKRLYEARHRVLVHELGLLRHPKMDFIGASPDGITEHGVMLEIKCPWRRKIQPGDVPTQYMYQMQVQLDVCGLDHCDFLEVALKEYGDEAEFVADGASPILYDARGMEKGVMVEHKVDDGGVAHVYMDREVITVDDALAWRDRAMRELEGKDPVAVYWHVDVFNVQRVVRDPALLAEIYEGVRDVWGRVLAYRQDMAAFEREVLNAPKAMSAAAMARSSSKLLGDLCICDSD